MSQHNSSLIFAHIGDLHLTTAKEQNYKDLLSIIADIETGCASKIDMVYLPGDNADHSDENSYQLLSIALKMLSVPTYVISGDHDMEKGNLDNLYAMSIAQRMPFSTSIKNIRCLFVDVCGNGKGGPDFRTGEAQLNWLKNEADQAKLQHETIAVFMHTFPDDLKDDAEKHNINSFIKENDVVLVDMGHTHYNEIANDGKTIFAATRSTGQIEEGPVGYSIISVYKNVVSWRFKLLDEPFPFVLITFPADYRIATKLSKQDDDVQEISAVVMSVKKIKSVVCKIDDEEWMIMNLSANNKTWVVHAKLNTDKPVIITVKATDESGRPGMHQITYSSKEKKIQDLKPGSDEYAIGSWPENHIFGTQLGPNRNAKPPKK